MSGVNNAKDYIDLMGFGYTATIDGSPNTAVVTNSLLQGGIVSVYYLGTLFGALFGGWLGDRIGRVKSIAVGAAWAVLGASLQCSAQNHNWMICGKTRATKLDICSFLSRRLTYTARFINGIGTGILNAIVPVWATETVSTCRLCVEDTPGLTRLIGRTHIQRPVHRH